MYYGRKRKLQYSEIERAGGRAGQEGGRAGRAERQAEKEAGGEG